MSSAAQLAQRMYTKNNNYIQEATKIVLKRLHDSDNMKAEYPFLSSMLPVFKNLANYGTLKKIEQGDKEWPEVLKQFCTSFSKNDPIFHDFYETPCNQHKAME